MKFDKNNLFHTTVLENTLTRIRVLLKKQQLQEKACEVILQAIKLSIEENVASSQMEDKTINKYIEKYLAFTRQNLQIAIDSYLPKTLVENKKFIDDFAAVWPGLVKQKKRELAARKKNLQSEFERDIESEVIKLQNTEVVVATEKGDRDHQEDKFGANHIAVLHESWENHLPELIALSIQQLFKELYESSTPYSFKEESKKISERAQKEGATFTLILKSGGDETSKQNKLITAWVGDSPGVVLFTDRKSGKLLKIQSLTAPHQPNCAYDFGDKELQRARQTGEIVYEITGTPRFSKTMLSRSVGDLFREGLMDTPTIAAIDIPADQEEIIILGSDGLFDCLSNEDIKECYKECFEKAKSNMEKLAQLLREKAYKNQYGNADNITVVVVKKLHARDYILVTDGHASNCISSFIKGKFPKVVDNLTAKPAPKVFLAEPIHPVEQKQEPKEFQYTDHTGLKDIFKITTASFNSVDTESNLINKTFHYVSSIKNSKELNVVQLLDYCIADLRLIDSEKYEIKEELLKIFSTVANKNSLLASFPTEARKYLAINIFDYIREKVRFWQNSNPLYQACMGFVAAFIFEESNNRVDIKAIRFISQDPSYLIDKIEDYMKKHRSELEKIAGNSDLSELAQIFSKQAPENTAAQLK